MAEHSRFFEMSISSKEFRRLLPTAVAGASFEERGDVFVHAEPGRSWRFTLSPLPERELGTLRLERHGVEWRFSGYTEAEIEALVDRFALHFPRGGG